MHNNKLLKYGSVAVDPALQTNTYYTTNVIVVGCGGTGGRLIPGLVQHISNHNRVIETVPANKQFLKHKMSLTLIDADIVETKNLLRQNFHTFDVGKNKAEVMALRYGVLNGMDIKYIPFFIEPGSKTFNFSQGDVNTIVFDCTDNVKARREIEAQIQGSRRVIISCGNEDTFGQVLLSISRGNNNIAQWKSNITEIKKVLDAIEDPKVTYKGVFNTLPTLLELFTGFKDTVAPSCTDIQLQDEQSMPINALVAQLAYNVFYNLVAGNKFTYNMVKCSTNNIYDTKFISHPIALLETYLKSFMGDASPEAAACFRDASKLGFKDTNSYSLHNIKYEDIIDFINVHGHYTKKFIKIYLENNYYVKNENLSTLNGLLNTWEIERANL